jgi:hypothetical protein
LGTKQGLDVGYAADETGDIKPIAFLGANKYVLDIFIMVGETMRSDYCVYGWWT